ncbi:uncharacterized protein LOC123255883 isoform X1 [Gracilinanus agilis]|uniref:uncharacterized protein LOC123255883 isoform X1 n=1 Tax=Gracilinanus agilis TaxID=191870 RepID=UPI001CFD69EB|nr:uncharacterized protein LOC123255883 isoform X1 [Gracilinanus agilis]
MPSSLSFSSGLLYVQLGRRVRAPLPTRTPRPGHHRPAEGPPLPSLAHHPGKQRGRTSALGWDRCSSLEVWLFQEEIPGRQLGQQEEIPEL